MSGHSNPQESSPPTSLREQIHNIAAETIQIERIGRATDPKPENRIWFTTQLQDMFALVTDLLEAEIEILVASYIEAAEIEARIDQQRKAYDIADTNYATQSGNALEIIADEFEELRKLQAQKAALGKKETK